MLYMSGYSREQLKKCLISAIVGYERRVQRESDRGEKVHRDGMSLRKDHTSKNYKKIYNWYKQSKSNIINLSNKYWGNKRIRKQHTGCSNKAACAPVFIPRTPNWELVTKIREVEDQYSKYSKRKVKVAKEVGIHASKAVIPTRPMGRKRLW